MAVTIRTADDAYLLSLYQGLLQRAPDDAGFLFWSGQLAKATATRTQVYNAFLNSAEYATRFVTQLYRSLLGREPDTGGLTFYVSSLASGRATREAVYAGFLGSPEYQAKKGKPTAAIQRIADPAALYSVVGSNFQGTVAGTLGNFGTGNDGFDAVMAVPVSAVDADHAAISELDAAIAAADFGEGELAVQTLTPLFAEIGAFIAGGQGLMDGLLSLFGL